MTDVRIVLMEVQREYAELALKTEKLRQFLVAYDAAVKATKRSEKSLSKDGWRFDGVTLSHRCILVQQYGAMDMYKTSLEARLLSMSKEINARAKKKAKK